MLDDDEELASLYAIWLEQSYTVEVVHDCASAYDRFDGSVDVALLDRQLPDGSGEEVLAAIRESNLDWRVAMVTGEEPSVEVATMGFDDYLHKPVTEEELLGTVERLVTRANSGDATRELYALSSKISLLETHHSSAELGSSEEYAAMEARFAELREELDEMPAGVP